MGVVRLFGELAHDLEIWMQSGIVNVENFCVEKKRKENRKSRREKEKKMMREGAKNKLSCSIELTLEFLLHT